MDLPEISFFQDEAQFKLNVIISKEIKFNYLVSQLEPKYVENIWDIVASNSTTKYSKSKTRLLDLFKKKPKALELKKLLLELI